jgi:hypothetical protein
MFVMAAAADRRVAASSDLNCSTSPETRASEDTPSDADETVLPRVALATLSNTTKNMQKILLETLNPCRFGGTFSAPQA